MMMIIIIIIIIVMIMILLDEEALLAMTVFSEALRVRKVLMFHPNSFFLTIFE